MSRKPRARQDARASNDNVPGAKSMLRWPWDVYYAAARARGVGRVEARAVGAYALALVSVAVATALRVVLDPYLEGAQFVTFYPAIAITTLVSGFGAGFFSAVLSTAAADFFLLSPRWAFSFEDPATVADL